jgi:hypothetical protein
MASADECGRRITAAYYRCCIYHFCWRVTMLAFTRRGINFYQLGEVNMPAAKRVNDRISIRAESIGSDLKFASSSAIQLFSEGKGIRLRAPSKMPSKNHLSVTLKSYEAISVAKFGVITTTFFLQSFFHFDESPYLITLNIKYGHVFNAVF